MTSHPNRFNRPPRILRLPPAEEVEIPGPPPQPGGGLLPTLLAVAIPTITALLYFATGLARSQQGASGGLLATPIILISFVSAGAAWYTYRRQRRAQADAALVYEERYRVALDQAREQLQRLEQAQRDCRCENDPEPDALLSFARGPAERLWERRPGDLDFLRLRVGCGDAPTATKIKPPTSNPYAGDLDRSLALAEQFRLLRDVPLTVPLREIGSLGIAGAWGYTLDTLRALIWQIVAHHAPSDVRIAAFWESADDPSWEWLSWLPHTRSLDGDGSYRLLARYDRNPEDMQQVLGALATELKRRSADTAAESRPARPHLVVIVPRHGSYAEAFPLLTQLAGMAALDVSAIYLAETVAAIPGPCGGYIDLNTSPHRAVLALTGSAGGRSMFRADQVGRDASNALCRSLAPIEANDGAGAGELPRNVPLLPLLGVADARAYDPLLAWAAPPRSSWHPVPVGMQSADEPLLVDLNEGMHGVHGMIAGATGAGKSELLLSFLMALAIRHSPDRLNFMLIDFKGGATFRDLEHLPHTAGFVTDLSGFLAERALIAMNSELDRRKRLLNDRGTPNIRSYRAAGLDLPGQHMPNLLIAIDEFDEMLRDYPEFQLELVRVAKQGRSLGVHLLFATQQPSLVKEGLTNNLSYWMSLRVNSKDDSKAMVGLPDAALLGTGTPGRGYFRDKNSGVRLFQSALITAMYQPPVGSGLVSREVDVTGRHRLLTDERRVQRAVHGALAELLDGVRGTLAQQAREQAVDRAAYAIAVAIGPLLDHGQRPAEDDIRRDCRHEANQFLEQVGRLAHNDGEAVEKVLQEAPPQIVAALRGNAERVTEITIVAQRMAAASRSGYAAETYPIWAAPLEERLPLARLLTPAPAGWLTAPIGQIDRPEHADRATLRYDPLGAGNLLALGAAGSGKTTLLATIAVSMAAAAPPSDLWIYIIDGGAALGLRDGDRFQMPHIADAVAPREHLRVERLMAEIQEQMEIRRDLFQQHGVTNIRDYHTKDSANRPPTPWMILVLIDGIAELTAQNEPVAEVLRGLLREGRSYGVVFAATGYGTRDVGSLIAGFEARIALRLNSEDDSTQLIGKDYAAKLIRPDTPGRGFMRGSPRPQELQVALPALQDEQEHGAAVQSGDTAVAYSNVGRTLATAARIVGERWVGPACLERIPRRLQLLPVSLDLGPLLAASHGKGLAVPLGQDGSGLQIVCWRPAQTAHLLITGARGSGKGTFLRTLLTALSHLGAGNTEFVLVDYGLRALRDFEANPQTRTFHSLPVGKDMLDVALISSKEELLPAFKQVAEGLAERARSLRQTNTRPTQRTFLVINNWDLTSPGEIGAALVPLESFARRGADLGFHCVITNIADLSATTGLIKSIRTDTLELVLGRPAEGSSQATAISKRFRAVLSGDMPPGRGFLLAQGRPPAVVQFAH